MLLESLGFILVVVSCFLLGWVGHSVLSKDSSVDGTLIVDDRDENVTHWTLQYDQDPNDIMNKKTVRFNIKVQK